MNQHVINLDIQPKIDKTVHVSKCIQEYKNNLNFNSQILCK